MNNTIFTRGPSLNNRLAIALVISVGLMLADHKLNAFSGVRIYLNSLVSPLQYLANLPGQALNWSANRLVSHQRLVEENTRLVLQATLLNEKLQRFQLLEKENAELRELLAAPVRDDLRKMISELMAVEETTFSRQIVIDKGAGDDVYVGQPVLDDKGVVGQVMQVGQTNSRVLLLADVSHGIPVRIARNNIRMVASGTGQLDRLFVDHLPHSTDIREGDVLVSSGLGKVFPAGYPVAVITSVQRDEGRPFARVSAKPVAELDRLKYLLLLWPNNQPEAD